jgi:hypothetical protein
MGVLFGVCYTDMCAFQAISRTAFVVPTPGIDLSVGSIAGLSGVTSSACRLSSSLWSRSSGGRALTQSRLARVCRPYPGIHRDACYALCYAWRCTSDRGRRLVHQPFGRPGQRQSRLRLVGNARRLNLPVMMYIMVIIGGIGAFIARHTSSGSMSTLWAAMNARLSRSWSTRFPGSAPASGRTPRGAAFGR